MAIVAQDAEDQSLDNQAMHPSREVVRFDHGQSFAAAG